MGFCSLRKKTVSTPIELSEFSLWETSKDEVNPLSSQVQVKTVHALFIHQCKCFIRASTSLISPTHSTWRRIYIAADRVDFNVFICTSCWMEENIPIKDNEARSFPRIFSPGNTEWVRCAMLNRVRLHANQLGSISFNLVRVQRLNEDLPVCWIQR